MSLGGERASTHTVNSARHRNNEGPPISWFGVGGVAGVLHSIVALPPHIPNPRHPDFAPNLYYSGVQTDPYYVVHNRDILW